MEILNTERPSKLHYWFKSYGDYAEWVNFAHWWSFIGKGLCLQPAQQACLDKLPKWTPTPMEMKPIFLKFRYFPKSLPNT